FVIDEAQAQEGSLDTDHTALPYDFNSGAELMALCRLHDMSISELMMENEKAWRPEAEVRAGLWDIWQAMQECVERGVHNEGILPGGLNVKRRAAALYRRLEAMADDAGLIASTFSAMDWVNVYALAVNEENAAGGRMVTAPTNGAAGI